MNIKLMAVIVSPPNRGGDQHLVLVADDGNNFPWRWADHPYYDCLHGWLAKLTGFDKDLMASNWLDSRHLAPLEEDDALILPIYCSLHHSHCPGANWRPLADLEASELNQKLLDAI